MKTLQHLLLAALASAWAASCAPVPTGSNDYILSNNSGTALQAVVYYTDAAFETPEERVHPVDEITNKTKDKVNSNIKNLKEDVQATVESVKKDIHHVKKLANQIAGDSIFKTSDSISAQALPKEEPIATIPETNKTTLHTIDTFELQPNDEAVVLTKPTMTKFLIDDHPDLTKDIFRVELHYANAANNVVWEEKRLDDQLYIRKNGNGYQYILYTNPWKAWFQRNVFLVTVIGIIVLLLSYMLYRVFNPKTSTGSTNKKAHLKKYLDENDTI